MNGQGQEEVASQVRELERELARHVGDINRVTYELEELKRSLFTTGSPSSYVRQERVSPDISNQRVQVQLDGVDVGDPRPSINIVTGTGATPAVTEDPDENRIDIQIDVP